MNIFFNLILLSRLILQIQAFYKYEILISDSGGNYFDFESIYIYKCSRSAFVLSSDLTRCIHYREELGILELGNCIRLGEDGYCAEARDSIDVVDGNLSFSRSNIDSSYCAQIDRNYTKCLYPRFGYTLDLKKQMINRQGKFPNFCALYDTEIEKCVEFFPKIIPRPKNGLPILINQFINSQKIDYLQSADSLTTIICKDGYDFIGSLDDPIGCISKMLGGSFEKPIPNCDEHIHKNRLCKKCKNGFSIHKNKHSCTNIKIKNCIEYDEIQGKIICWTCKPFYRFSFGKCIKMDNCLVISKSNPNWCNQRGSDSQPDSKNQGFDFNKRADDRFEYYKILDRQKNFDQTYCKEESNFISYNNLEKMRTDFDLAHPQSIELFKINYFITPTCNKRLNYPIKNCSKYHAFLDSCQECDKGYYLENQSGQFTRQSMTLPKKNHYDQYNYICKENNPQYKRQNIQYCKAYSPDGQSCIQCEQGYYEKSNQCLLGVENCLLLQSQFQCVQCKKGYINFTCFDYIYYGVLEPEEICIKNENMIMKSIKDEYNSNNRISFQIVKKEFKMDLGCDTSCQKFKECKSIYTRNQPNECLLNIPESFYVNYPLYEEIEQYPLKICYRDSCLECEFGRCLKCEKEYVLDSNFQCQKACIKNKVEVDCIQIENSEDENSNHNNEDKEDTNKTNNSTDDKNDNNTNETNEGKDQNNENKGNGSNNEEKREEKQKQIEDHNQKDESSNTQQMIIIVLSGISLGIILIIVYRWMRKRTLARQLKGIDYQEQISEI